MSSQVKPCPCGYRTCNDWHVHPQAAVQGVSFTEEEAKVVAAVLSGTAFAVVYDVYDHENDFWQETFYEVFHTPEEAERMFLEAYPSAEDRARIYNPRVVQVLHRIPGQFATEKDLVA
jgi:hypothetical protein